MSRWSVNEPDLDRYEDREPDVAYFPKDGQPWSSVVDPAEHAAAQLIDALATMERQLIAVTDVERAVNIKKLVHQAWEQMDRVDLKASHKIDELMERRR